MTAPTSGCPDPSGSRQPPRAARPLSPRQAQVTELVAEGLRNRDIALRLGLAEHTVRNQMARIFVKLGVSNRTMLALWLVRGGRP